MLDTPILSKLPTSAELPDSDDTPVDNEIQNLIPNLLKTVLAWIWSERNDWFFGVDMGIYDRKRQETRKAIVPDGFLSIGVERFKGQQGRLSYVLAEENEIIPLLVLEIVSKTYGGEYDDKMLDYAELGVLYYLVYDSRKRTRKGHEAFEVYRLINGVYRLQEGNPFWLEEIGLGIGLERGIYESWERDWLYWYDQQGNRYQIPEERVNNLSQSLRLANREIKEKQQENQKLQTLLAKYQEMFGNLPE